MGLPSGGYKGVGIGLMAELFAAVLSGAELGIDAAPFGGTAGGPPKTGQFFVAIDPGVTSGGRFAPQLARLAKALDAEEGARLPGSRRLAARARAVEEGVAVSRSLLAEIAALQAAG